MQVCYWAEINCGARMFSGHFADFGLNTIDVNPLTLRENLKYKLQVHIDSDIEFNKKIPPPSGIELPLIAPSTFVGFIPVVVDVPDEIVNGWNK